MKSIGLIGLSDPCQNRPRIIETKTFLESLGHTVSVSPLLYKQTAGRERAKLWNEWMGKYDFLFDVSGGDLANETIPYLYFDRYASSQTIFCGYSDLTCVLNVLGPMRPCLLFQIVGNANRRALARALNGDWSELVIGQGYGGNIRCFLKLAGTPYMPDLTGSPLYLESRSGDAFRIRSYFAQLAMMGIFERISGLYLGTFTELNDEDCLRKIAGQYTHVTASGLPFGHENRSKAVWIGGSYGSW
ncbi:LD-carboxypeptidase [Catenisphaera adipataccumulans]|jgi:muramoyltetrapeptide carboxypeptidase|uniref:Muramoyltetrapeptide carboxypeptidase LdcA involved in peptidoglycan recycling n=1 Tax=Catenisphaera adipataccumulans TaxID=700500 RepID=A0A7W8CY07_9FIRM|nr:LD-carboxypeptidase [Catenisphaera adipataccumulans]MBB5183466.1 muramoyltetrapeptide carboxypeptidase LdcA involved in peptidoglycan recycling [Catenisphaera adipataccumulans]